jgi:hypothetical protein
MSAKGEQRPESFGLIVLDSLARPLEPRQVILKRGAYRIQVGCTQVLVRRLRILTGHPHSVALATSPVKQSLWLVSWTGSAGGQLGAALQPESSQEVFVEFHPNRVAGVDIRLGDPRSFAASSSAQGGSIPFRISGKRFQRRRELLAHGPNTNRSSRVLVWPPGYTPIRGAWAPSFPAQSSALARRRRLDLGGSSRYVPLSRWWRSSQSLWWPT